MVDLAVVETETTGHEVWLASTRIADGGLWDGNGDGDRNSETPQ
jgi:hypothetical protein